MTPVGVRDGDPDALAGLCDRRGPAVLAYCEVVAGRGETAAVAAADAFGSFRAGVVAAPDLANLNPEALLISATRHAAARYAGTDLPPEHRRVPALLAARADRSITLADHDFLEQHLAACWTCRAPVARFEAADRAYLDPPTTALAPEVKAAMVAALTAAAPVLGAEPEPEPPAYVPGPGPRGRLPQRQRSRTSPRATSSSRPPPTRSVSTTSTSSARRSRPRRPPPRSPSRAPRAAAA